MDVFDKALAYARGQSTAQPGHVFAKDCKGIRFYYCGRAYEGAYAELGYGKNPKVHVKTRCGVVMELHEHTQFEVLSA